MEKYNILSPWQNGFRKKRSTDNIFIMKTTRNKYLEKKREKIYWCFIDLEKAFDMVNREML